MSRLRIVATLGLGVALGAAAGYFAFEDGWYVFGARPARGAASAREPAAPESPASEATPASLWRPEPIRFRTVAALGGLPAVALHGTPAWGDLERDGDPDLFVAGGADEPCALYLNLGRGVLVAASERLHLAADAHYRAGAFADFDADGDLDLFLAGTAGTRDLLLAQHPDGRFEPATEEYGLRAPGAGETGAASWCDLDGDGRLDLYRSREGAPDLLDRREAGATFDEVALQAGLDAPLDPRFALVGDADGDGDLDVFLAAGDAQGADRLFVNRGDGSFVETSSWLGVASPRTSLAAALGDADGDGLDDLLLAPAAGGLEILRAVPGPGAARRFEEAGAAANLPPSGARYRQVAFADFDLDGALDAVALGESGLALFRNEGRGVFRDGTEAAGWSELPVGPGSAFALADFDLDGDVDLVLTGVASPALLENRARGASWLRIEPRGQPGNPQGIGACVRIVTPDGRRIVRAVRSGADEGALTIGLGGASRAAEVRADWSGGGETRVQSVPAGSALPIEETRASRLVGSHAAALVGELASFPLEPALERVADNLGGSLPAPDPVEIERRLQSALAWSGSGGDAPSDPPWLAAARERVEGEVRLELGARVAVQRLRIPPAAVEERLAERRAQWDRPARVAGTLFMLRDASAAAEARQRAQRGESSAALAADYALTDLESDASDSPGHARPFAIDAALWSRLAADERPPFATGALPEPGAVTPVHPRADGFTFLVVEQVFPPAPLRKRAARERAFDELRRERASALVDELLGLPPDPRQRPAPRD